MHFYLSENSKASSIHHLRILDNFQKMPNQEIEAKRFKDSIDGLRAEKKKVDENE